MLRTRLFFVCLLVCFSVHVVADLSRIVFSSVQFNSVCQSCLTLCDPMNRSTPSLPVHYQLPESTQTHVHRVDDAIQPFHPLLSPSPPVLNLSKHQGLFHVTLRTVAHQASLSIEFSRQEFSRQFSCIVEGLFTI